ncbi:MAG: hypothetical protein KME21_18290 [Desmonostoc vinosum HA7617-LM4]|jgi:hypothetical protein|nr:hypothetical protein [Desmonostoc vinosum HA7617-LM4]
MNHFNFKSLTFYGVAIGSVLLLFKAVTAYGENHLQASPMISDRYRLTLIEKLPNCEKSDKLMLNIQQSGIYLNASLLPLNTNAENEKNLTLTGIFKNQQLSLSGKIDSSIFCFATKSQDTPLKSATMQMQLADKGDITGKIIINAIPRTLGFTATPQNSQEKSQNTNKH